MFDQKILQATPANARRLIEFSKLNRKSLPDTLVKLAEGDLINRSVLKNGPLELDDAESRVLQRIVDWKGRGLILDDGCARARKVALANTKLHYSGPTLILVHPQNYPEWAELVLGIWPSASISVFGNPRYHTKRTTYPDGIEFSENPDLSADFLITSCASVHWHDLLTNITPSNTIVEELDNSSAFGYTIMDGIRGLLREIGPVVLIQDVNRLKRSGNENIITALESSGSQTLHQLSAVISEFLWAGNNLPNLLLNQNANSHSLMYASTTDLYPSGTSALTQAAQTYLYRRGYSAIDIWKILPVLAVSAELIEEGATRPMEFDDPKVQKAAKDKSKSRSGIVRILERERELEDHTGQTMDQLVQRASTGDSSASSLITGLRTTQWANVKSASIKNIVEGIGTRLTKTLIIAENVELVRSLKLSMPMTSGSRYFACESLAHSTSPSGTIARFLYPDASYLRYIPDDKSDIRPLDVLIIRQSDLDNSDLLRVANYVILAEWPTDLATYQVIREEYVEPSGARLIHSTLLGTVEEKIRKIMTGK